MDLPTVSQLIKATRRWWIGLLLLCCSSISAQTFNFPSTEVSEIVTGDTLYARGFPSSPDSMTVWCNDWDTISIHSSTWRQNLILKSNNAFVKFEVNDLDTLVDYLSSIGYTYRLTYTIYGYNNPSDTVHGFVSYSDTLTISFNNTTDNTPYQNKNWKKYSGFYKILVVYTGMYRDSSGTLLTPPLSDPAYRNFQLEGSIVTQHYDKAPYGIGSGVTTPAINMAHIANNNLYLGWSIGVVTPVSYELEWSYIDNYEVAFPAGTISTLSSSSLSYNFTNNSTRVWLDESNYTIPCIYPNGYIVYRVRAIRPDSSQFKYPIYGDWSYSVANTGNVGTLSTAHDTLAVMQIPSAYVNDSLNWQYTVSFAEGGKYKNVLSFYDGLLKNRQSITRFNSSPNKLIVTDNVYDYEGRLCIKTLPAPVNTNYFNYQHNVDLNALTHIPYRASDFDSGISVCITSIPAVAPLDTNALASIYYSHRNPDISLGNFNKYIPDAQGYPFVQTVFQPGFADRVAQQGGAGPRLQIGDTNFISNAYVSPSQLDLNALFSTNIGWANFYMMTVSNDANQQLSMSVKDYHGKQMASAMIGTGPDTSHAILPMSIPGATFYKQDLLSPYTSSQAVDTMAGTRTADVDYFNEANGATDSLQYFYSFTPFNTGCKYLTVAGHFNAYVTDQCGITQLTESQTVGTDGVSSSGTPVTYSAPLGFFSGARAAPYHVHKALSIYPSDLDAALNAYYATLTDSCFLQQPYFIKQSVDNATFPCMGNNNADSTPCSKLKWEMMQQLFPGAVYGQYFIDSGYVVGTNNSIFSLNCPSDTLHLTGYYTDSIITYCYSPAEMCFDTIREFTWYDYYHTRLYRQEDEYIGVFPVVDSVIIRDTCPPTSTFSTFLTIKVISDGLVDTVIGDLGSGNISGSFTIITHLDSLGGENGTISSTGGSGSIRSMPSTYGGYEDHSISYITIPVTITLGVITASFIGTLPISGDTIKINFNGTTPYIYSAYYYLASYSYDTVISGYNAGPCSYSPGMHYRYQDTCTVSLQDTITINGVFYSGLTTMRTDSFIMIYNTAIAAQNYTLAQELLPLHPQYCELSHCFNDSFQTEVLAIPNWTVAQSLGLFYLDSLIAHDPIADTLTSIGLSTDSLRTFPGGLITLDTFIIMNAYCSSWDSIVSAECYSDMFNYEITHRLLINAAVEAYYFNNLYSLYFSNRQRIIDELETRAGTSCTHCALARMSLDPSAILPPPPTPLSVTPSTYDSAFAEPLSTTWLYFAGHYSDAALYDSTLMLYHAEDSLLAYGEIDTIMAHLSDCIAGNSSTATKIMDTLISIYKSGAAPSGNFTFQQIRHAISSSGVSLSDLCNPYIIDCSQFGAQKPIPVNDCLPSNFYSDMTAILNRSPIVASFVSPGTSNYDALDTATNSFGQTVGRMLGGIQSPQFIVSYTPSQQLYRLMMVPATGGSDTVNMYFHSPVCGNIFASPGCTFSISVACINSIPSMESSAGLINEYSYVATVTANCSGTITTCTMPGYVDSVQTMTYMNNALSVCIPCTQLRSLYTQFNDTLLAYGIFGSDHPYYDVMLTNFLNYNLQQSYSSVDYETFIQSCALADSMKIPLYTGYTTFTFNNRTDMVNFIDTLDSVDPAYSFDNCFRDSVSSLITVCVNLNSVPETELWMYKNKLNGYSSAHYHTKAVDAPLSRTMPHGAIGFIYYSSGLTFNPRDSAILGDTSTVKWVGPGPTAIWIGGNFVMQNIYYLMADTINAKPYSISQDVYEVSAYLYNHATPGVVFVPFYESTINSDYFKSQKQSYLKYVYGYQSLPSYQVIDSIQSQYLTSRISSYSTYLPNYAQGNSWGNFTNLYLFNTGWSGRLYDTLTTILNHANGASSSGYIFHQVKDTTAYSFSGRNIMAYICSDGSYWYRYFTTGDTMYNVYVSFPAYIPGPLQYQYKEVAVIPTPGDSLNRTFTLDLVRSGTTDTIQATGRCDFVIGNSIELQNVALGQALGGPNDPGTDTFDNCERQTLYSAINNGLANYNQYVDSIKNSISGKFRSYVVSAVSEQMELGYKSQEFAYTLYNYDRAGNLAFTVPPAGLTPIPNTGNNLVEVDTARINNTSYTGTAPVYSKINNYNYNTLNQLTWQQTIDGGKTRFFYDAAGRMIFSQNAKQGQQGYYTYNIYDHQNRITETGEVKLGCPYFDPYTSSVGIAGGCYYTYYEGTTGGMFGGLTFYLYTPDPYAVEYVDKIPADSVVWYIRSNNRRDAVMTIYDTVAKNLGALTGLDNQQNLRQRVSCIKYFENLAVIDTTYAHYTYATHFSYDIEGNVQTLTHDYPALDPIKQRYKRVDYDYDLISGKVNMLSYNRGWPDQFYQRYYYDADNRITQVQTSNDGFIWQQDASYTYYEHGPLARIQEGQLNVQGIDYAYTIQGWLKAMNSDTLNSRIDMGQDAYGNSVTAKDAVAYSIDYFTNDYKPISSIPVSYVQPETKSLYNGNISRQTECIAAFKRLNKQYMYDQLNRIETAAYASINTSTNALGAMSDFHNNYQYDMDGNIQKLVRYGNNTGSGALLMDSLSYVYPTTGAINNRLQQLYDYSPNNYADSNDIKHYTTGTNRYQYDAIGNTTKDLVNGQDTVEWNLYNKVTYTQNNAGNNNMSFTYDGAGNRVAKFFTQGGTGSYTDNNDYYVRDAQGNILAIYHEKEVYGIVAPSVWTTAVGAALRAAAPGGTVQFINSFVAPDFGPLEPFRNAIINYGLLNGTFVTGALGQPVSYFMSNSPGLYQDVLFNTPAYLPQMVDSERAGVDTFIGPALTGWVQQDPGGSTAFLAGLLADTAQGANVLGLLCSVSTGYSVLDSLVNIFYDTSVSGLSCDSMVSMLQDSSISSWALANSLVNIMQLDSPAISQYMELIGIDTALYTDSAIRPFMQASVQYALAGYGSNSRILTFFNNYTGTSNILSEISSPAQLMTIAYNANLAGFLDTFASVVGVAYIDSAVATVPGLGLLPYAYEACGALGVSTSSISVSMESLVSHQFGLAEHDFYGSSRLGIKNYYGDEVGFTWSYPNTWADTVRLWKPVPWYSLEYQDVIKTDSTNLYGNTFTDLYTTEHVLGKKQYELTDHLGDVLATVSDKRANDSLTTYGGSTGSPDTVRTWKPVVVAAYDYYPFGEYMPTRYTNDSTTHCYTATLPELVHSIFYTPWTIWPLYTGGSIVLVGGGGTTATLSGTTDMALTTTAVGGGFSYDLTGLYSGFSASMTISLSAISGSFTATLTDDSTGAMIGSTNVYNTQGNTIVYSVPFTAASRSATLTFLSTSGSGGGTFTGFGDPHDTMLLENVVTLVCDEEWYRYGHNGQMKNNQWAGLGNHYQFKEREYDPRTGKFISVDPLFAKYPGNASYNFAQDRVIDGKDLEGKEYLPGNPAADFVFDIVVNKLVGGAAQFKAGVDNVVAARSYQENGNGGGASPQNIPTGAGAQMYAKTQEADGWTNIAEGASKVYVGTAELTLATYGAAEDVAATEILGLKFGVNAGESVEPEAVGFGNTNEKGLLDEGPTEPYNRQKHYGNTPTQADRKALGASQGEVVNHKTPLVKHYYEGEGGGSKPGYKMTPAERKSFAKDRSKMDIHSNKESQSQGGTMSNYSKEKKEEHFGK